MKKRMVSLFLVLTLAVSVFSISAFSAGYVSSPQRPSSHDDREGIWDYQNKDSGNWESYPLPSDDEGSNGMWESSSGETGTWHSDSTGNSGTWKSDDGKTGTWEKTDSKKNLDENSGTWQSGSGDKGVWHIDVEVRKPLPPIYSPQTGEEFPVFWVICAVVLGTASVIFAVIGKRRDS